MNLIVQLSKKIHTKFTFLKSKILFVASESIIGKTDATQDNVNQTWDEFLSTYQDKIATDSVESVVVLHGSSHPQTSKIQKI